MCFVIEDNIIKAYEGKSGIIHIPDGIEVVKRFSVSSPLSIREVTIPDSVRKIGFIAFSGFWIDSIIIPDSVQVLGESSFEGCSFLKSVVIGKGVKDIPSDCFSGCQDLVHLELPEALERVGRDAFERCYSLRSAWVNGVEYRLRDTEAPKAVKLVYKSIYNSRQKVIDDFENGVMDEFEYTDYCIAGHGYSF